MRRFTLALALVLVCVVPHRLSVRADVVATARQLPHLIERQQMVLDCEAAALQAALSTLGIDDSQGWLTEQIPVDPSPAMTSHGQVLRWGDPFTAFVGDVNGSEPRSTGYGVYAPPIAAAAERAGARATWATQWVPSLLYAQVLAGHAAVVWVIVGLAASTTEHYTAWDGRVIPYSVGEHAMALVGVDMLAGTVTLADPHSGRDITAAMGVFERSFAVFENMAVVLGVADGTGIASSLDGRGYVVAGSDGSVHAAGDGRDVGSMAGSHLNQAVVGIAATPSGRGYWLVAGDGGVFPFGDARGYGSTGGMRLNQPIVGVAATRDGGGYWLVASDGGIFPFGDASGYGSTGNIRLSQPIVGMTATPSGHGYWLVAADGGIFPFGDAGGYGSTGALHLDQPIVAMAPSPRGYWLVASDGEIFPFGDARGLGAAAPGPTAPIAGIVSTPDLGGYWLVARDGTASAFGDAAALAATAG